MPTPYRYVIVELEFKKDPILMSFDEIKAENKTQKNRTSDVLLT